MAGLRGPIQQRSRSETSLSPAGGSKARRRGLAVIVGVLGLCLVAAVVATLANARSSAIALVSHRIGRPVPWTESCPSVPARAA